MKGEFFFLLLFVIATSLLFCAAFATTAARLDRIDRKLGLPPCGLCLKLPDQNR